MMSLFEILEQIYTRFANIITEGQILNKHVPFKMAHWKFGGFFYGSLSIKTYNLEVITSLR